MRTVRRSTLCSNARISSAAERLELLTAEQQKRHDEQPVSAAGGTRFHPFASPSPQEHPTSASRPRILVFQHIALEHPGVFRDLQRDDGSAGSGRLAHRLKSDHAGEPSGADPDLRRCVLRAAKRDSLAVGTSQTGRFSTFQSPGNLERCVAPAHPPTRRADHLHVRRATFPASGTICSGPRSDQSIRRSWGLAERLRPARQSAGPRRTGNGSRCLPDRHRHTLSQLA